MMQKAKKRLGQYWLTSNSVIEKIIAAGQVSNKDTVLEIGPGQGVLTKALLATGAKVIAVEKDAGLVADLKLKLKDKNLKLTLGDIRDCKPPAKTYKLIANIPYYLTGQLIRLFLTTKNQPALMVLLVQKEVAKKITDSKKESLLSISVKVYGEPHYIKTVKRGSFQPPPRVDSAILLIKNISKNNFKKIDEEKFFEILRRGFAHPRKLVRRNLGLSEIEWGRLNLPPEARAENLKLEDWLALSRGTLDNRVLVKNR